VAEGSVTSVGFEVGFARPEDDAAIRALLRRQALGGAIRLGFEREPDARLAAAVEGERHHTVVARRAGSGELLGMASRAVRRVWVNGERRYLGYLAQLRRVPELRGGRRLLREGFAACASTRRDDELPFDLTSVVADNANARRLLERGLPGLPPYRPFCDFLTFTFATGSFASGAREPVLVARGSEARLPAIVDCLERNLRRHQLTPAWTLDDLRSGERTRDLDAFDFFVVPDGDGGAGCLALWDQRRFKQVVVRGYAGAVGPLRPLVNVGLSLLGRPRLPAPGRPLALGFLSHVAIDDDRADVLLALVAAARRVAAERGLRYLSLGFAARHPLTDAVRRAIHARELGSVLYLVGPPADLDDRVPHVEAATL